MLKGSSSWKMENKLSCNIIKQPIAEMQSAVLCLNILSKTYLEAEAKTAFKDNEGLKLMTASIA